MGNDLTRRRDSLRGVLSNLKQLIFGRKGYTVLLGTKRCKVLGHIGMLHTVVDVTNVNCKLGDKAIFDVNPLLHQGRGCHLPINPKSLGKPSPGLSLR